MSARDGLHFHLDMSVEGAEALLDAYRAEVRREVLAEAADWLAEIGTPITGSRTQHDTGVMYAAERLRVLAGERP